MSRTERLVRQQDLVPQELLDETSCTVIGVGAIGRQLALQLAAIGVPQIGLVDFDTVELTNITTQGYLMRHLGYYKVEATAEDVNEIDPDIVVDPLRDRFRRKYVDQIHPVVFCCVDSVQARGVIWRTVKDRCALWVDGRMLGEVMRILAINLPRGARYYEDTLFSPEEAQQGACTDRSTIYTAGIAAGMMVHQFTRWLRKLELDRDTTFNLLAGELMVTE